MKFYLSSEETHVGLWEVEQVVLKVIALFLDFNPSFGEGTDDTDMLQISSTDFDTMPI